MRTSFYKFLVLLAALTMSLAPAATRPLPVLAASTVTVDGAVTYQTVDGFGASSAFQTASTIRGRDGLSAGQSKQILDLLFSPTTGAGLSIWRNHIGASSGGDDGDNLMSIEPKDPGGPDAKPNYVWDGSDGGQVWVSQQAKARGVTQFYASAWSAPAYMKTNADLRDGGYLCGVPGQACPGGDWRRHFADYLVQYARFYRDAGIDLSYVSFMNEPDFSPDYVGMNWDAANTPGQQSATDSSTPQLIDFINNYLGPALARSGLKTQIACCEATSWEHTSVYAQGVLANPKTKDYIGLITGHGYYAPTPGLLGLRPVASAVKAGKHVWQTEASSFDLYNGAWDSGSRQSSGYHWALVLWDAMVNNQVNGYLYWTAVWNNRDDNEYLIKVAGSSYQVSKRLWAFAGYSRYVRPGAVRIDATTPNSSLKVSAFRNTNGSVVITVLNGAAVADRVTFSLQDVTGIAVTPYLTNEKYSMSQRPALAISNGSFTHTVPARSLVTYLIPGPTSTPASGANPAP